MSPRYLFDTNVLVYAVDPRDPAKRDRARETIRRAVRSGSAALPSQALSEYANVRLKKLRPAPDPEAIGREVERLLLAFPVLALTGPVVLEALRGVRDHGLQGELDGVQPQGRIPSRECLLTVKTPSPERGVPAPAAVWPIIKGRSPATPITRS